MAGLMHFNNAGTFQQAFDAGREKKKAAGLASLMGDYAAGGAPDYQGIAQNGGNPLAVRQDADGQKDRSLKELGQMAGYLAALPDANTRAQAFQSLRTKLDPLGQQLGLPPLPAAWDEAHLPELQALAQQFGGNKDQASGVQSSFVDAQGRRMAIMRDGSVRELGQNAPNNQIIDTGNGFVGVNKGNLTAAPVMLGGQPPQPAQPQPAPPAGMYQTPQGIVRLSDDLSPEQREAAMLDMSNGGNSSQVTLPARNVQQFGGGQQLRSTPKLPAPRAAPAGYEWNADRSAMTPIPGGPAQLALDARKAAADAKQRAEDAKAEVGKVRQAEASQQASGLVAAIDRLTGSSGFDSLGTTWGDIERGVPLVRNDAKDADGQLKNIAGQVALTTMSRLKALSATGATGFGSLTAPELRLLENSLASLQAENISNKELRASLKIIRDSMQKVADWKGSPSPASGQQAPPANNGWSIQAVD